MSYNWSREEVEAIITDYLDMLTAELQLRAYNKTEHRNHLSKLLNNRSNGSIERKHQNISAILRELNHPWIAGYKPLGNYQQLLFDVVSDRVSVEHVQRIVAASTESPALVPIVENILCLEETPPERKPDRKPANTNKVGEPKSKFEINYLEREAHNFSLGIAGEKLVIQFEIARLKQAGRDKLADQVEHVAQTMGNSIGFDVHSYETTGEDRFIEVKTTGYGKATPFFLTKHELDTSISLEKKYQLYRVFLLRSDPHFFALRGRVDRTCVVDPLQYLCEVS
jgi:hypothetical protein